MTNYNPIIVRLMAAQPTFKPAKLLAQIQAQHERIILDRTEAMNTYLKQLDQNVLDQCVAGLFLKKVVSPYGIEKLKALGLIDQACQFTDAGRARLVELFNQFQPETTGIEMEQSEREK